MIIVREINLEAARSPEAFREITVIARAQARVTARQLIPVPLCRQAVIYIREENLVVHLGSSEDELAIRCWTPIADGKAVIFPEGPINFTGGYLRLGYPRSQGEAPLLFPNGREKEKRNEEVGKGKK